MENKVCECDGRGNYYSNNRRFKSLSYYYRMADRFIHQAELYRNQGNTTDLYITLDRYCSLISKMPQHPSYSTYSTEQKLHHDKICQEFSKELENLKLQIGHIPQVQENTIVLSNDKSKAGYCGEEEERTQSFINVSKENMVLSSAITTSCGTSCSRPGSSTSFIMGTDWHVNVNCVTQFSPSPVLSFIQSMPQAAHVSHINTSDSGHGYSQSSYQDVHISVRLMEDFLDLARDNTNNDLETCGVLGAFLKNGIFYVTTLIIPKQETTSSSCQALNEEEIYAIQSEHALFPVGWIHTHPSQTCFMSSIDLHTQYSYQVMLPEAVAIVMAPTDPTRTYGIFRICEPGGTTVLKECHETGFHPHQEPSDGSPIYEDCSNVYLNPNLRFEIFDLR